MKKILSWICIVFGLAVLVFGTSSELFNFVHGKKYYQNNKSWWGEHHSDNGDLVNMAYLDDINTFRSPKDYVFTTPADTGAKNIDLYVWGDSYLEDVPEKAFAHVANYHFGRTYYEELHYKLDKSKRNVLIIETSERFARPYFSYRSIYNSVSREKDTGTAIGATFKVTNSYAALGINVGIEDFFEGHINQNLEFLLFNYNFLNKPRFLKADMNYLLFNRGSGNVVISDNGRNLFIKETILPKHGYSSYQVLPNSDIDWFVKEFDSVYDHYKAEGFDEVYLSVIPTPVTILQPARYNHFLPRVSAHPNMNMPLIDLYPIFKSDANPSRLYRSGDTHWNNNGMQIWLGMVNEVLRKESGMH
ncbi:hypothetical protein CJD36_007855 [Flavipsychrobacter stenotrophus]|uniref:AlgX/AlgJ SGNH hydrolase-like domain-containing protein n=1 Tax=Flavipsychrobacter stenotrophus TaxID=2077091 RepID=A0A2S7SXP3_9BACT|nr:hypothetical protein [Flavipsychrobacter stenotrophus]PQJ11699.1 hypothetical protein CJD36_007855 [Flavipsychrobacter stenotrophus]